MSRTTCRSGFVLGAALGLGLMATLARGGNLDSPAAPTNSASAMWTLEDIYNVLNTRTTNVTKRAGATAFVEPTGEPTNGTMHTLNDVMALVTNRAPAAKTGQTTSYATDDDGALKLGVARPNPRFTIQADTNCVLDNLTGLIWARNANLWGAVNWGTAVTNCNDLDYGGTNDWRLPTPRELFSLFDAGTQAPALPSGQPFANLQTTYYWTSTSLPLFPANAYKCRPNIGDQYFEIKTTSLGVWPVRGGR